MNPIDILGNEMPPGSYFVYAFYANGVARLKFGKIVEVHDDYFMALTARTSSTPTDRYNVRLQNNGKPLRLESHTLRHILKLSEDDVPAILKGL